MTLRPNNVEDLVEILSGIDPNAPDVRDASGKRVLSLRCRVPFTFDAPEGAFRFARTPAVEGAPPEARSTDPSEGSILDRIEGPASSTSQDWYDTRMTKGCLEDMAAQFRAGVDYLPRHHSFMASVEWNDVMGRTVDARIERAEVKAAPEGESKSDQFILYTTTELYADHPLGPTLLSRIQAGRPPGQSIGGWFTQISVTYDDEGCVQYPIDVLGVDLDHLAAVRSPANPDADRVWLALTQKLGEVGAQVRSVPATPPAPVADPEPTPTNGGDPSTISTRSVGQGAPAPAPEPFIAGRTEFDTMTEEQIADLVRSAVAGALGPIVTDLAEIKARTSAPAPVPAAPPVPTETAAERSLRERAERAEAERDRLAAEPQRTAHRAATPPAPATPGVPEAFRIGREADLRTIAPLASRIIARAGDEIAPNEVPCLVWQKDGLGAVAQYAAASGEAPTLCALVAREKALTADASYFGPNGDDFGVYRGGIHPRAEQLRSQSDGELRSLLADLCYAAGRDRLFG